MRKTVYDCNSGTAGVVDMTSEEVAAVEASAPSLTEVKTALRSEIDAAAEICRLSFITAGAGQALTYMQKADQAAAYRAASSPVEADYPLLMAEVGITGETIEAVAGVIAASFLAWQQIGSQIEATRLGAKKAIEAAANVEAAIEAATVTWPGSGF